MSNFQNETVESHPAAKGALQSSLPFTDAQKALYLKKYQEIKTRLKPAVKKIAHSQHLSERDFSIQINAH